MDDELKGHLVAIENWLAAQRISARQTQGLSSDERKQLTAVNKTIQQLTSLGVAIPDELRQLKLQLSAKDVAHPGIQGNSKQISEIGEVIRMLNDLIKKAKVFQNQRKISERAPITKQHFDISLQELVESGFLSLDDKLELSWKKNGPVFEGKVLAAGAVMAKTQNGWKRFKSLSQAASTISGSSLNGWLHWQRVNTNGSRTPLIKIRDNYLNEGGAV